MKQFLNDFMEEHQDLDTDLAAEFRATFESAIRTVAEVLKPEALRPERNLNVSVADAVLVGLASRLQQGPITDADALCTAHERLLKRLKDGELYTTGTTNTERVNERIEIARAEYAAVE